MASPCLCKPPTASEPASRVKPVLKQTFERASREAAREALPRAVPNGALSTSWHGAYWLRINSHFPNRLSIISVFSLVSTYNVQVLQLFKAQTVSYLRETTAMSSETCIKILLACCFCIIVIKHARQIIQYLYLPYYLTRKDKKCKTRYEKIVLFK